MMLSKLLPDRIEKGFSLLGKAAQDQHGFRGDRVDHVTDLLVVKEQVDKLSNLDVINGDVRIVTGSYDQVLLLCTVIYLYIPHRRAIDFAFGECRIAKIGPN